MQIKKALFNQGLFTDAAEITADEVINSQLSIDGRIPQIVDRLHGLG